MTVVPSERKTKGKGWVGEGERWIDVEKSRARARLRDLLLAWWMMVIAREMRAEREVRLLAGVPRQVEG